MKNYLAFFTIISIFLFSKCSNATIAEFSLDSFPDSIRTDSGDSIQVNVCDIIEARWDSMLVIGPYASASEQAVLRDLKNYSCIKSRIKDIRSTDFYSYLVFVSNNRAIAFSRVYRGPVDFANLPVTDNRSPSVAVISKTNCTRLYLRRNGNLFLAKSQF
jgi:hypothetical protein